MIAPPELVEIWRRLAVRCEEAAALPKVDARDSAKVFEAFVAWASQAAVVLSAAAGTFAGMVRTAERSDGGPRPMTEAQAALLDGLARLAAELDAVQVGDGFACPMPTIAGTPFECGCPEGERCDPALAGEGRPS